MKKEINKSLRHKLIKVIKITITIIIYFLYYSLFSDKTAKFFCLDTLCIQYLSISVLGILPFLSDLF